MKPPLVSNTRTLQQVKNTDKTLVWYAAYDEDMNVQVMLEKLQKIAGNDLARSI